MEMKQSKALQLSKAIASLTPAELVTIEQIHVAQKLSKEIADFCEKKFYKDQDTFFKKRTKVYEDYQAECAKRVEGMSEKHPQRAQILKNLANKLDQDMKGLEGEAKKLLKTGDKVVKVDMKPETKKELLKFFEKHLITKYADQETALNRMKDYDLL